MDTSCIVIGVIPAVIAIIIGAISLADDYSAKYPGICAIATGALGVVMFSVILLQSYNETYPESHIPTPKEIVESTSDRKEEELTTKNSVLKTNIYNPLCESV